MSNQHPTLNHRGDIDGLRAIAVLSVVVFHAFPSVLRGGFIGVDVFFVISGFLISSLLMRSMQTRSFSLAEFYRRRIQRIFPALLAVLVCVYAFGWYVGLQNEFSQLGKHIVGGASFSSNIVLWKEAGYFDTASELKPLLHLWSLGVEEQFYILWPLFIFALWRYEKLKLPGLIAALAISFLINIKFIHSHPAATFYLPVSRFWELIAGAIAGYSVLAHKPVPGHGLRARRVVSGISVAGIALVGIGLMLTSNKSSFPGYWAALPVVGASCLLWAGPAAYVNRMVLSAPWLRGVGLISYPLYLWHWPILAFGAILNGGTAPSPWFRAAAIFASLGLAWATYRFIETPVRKSPASVSKVSMLACTMGIVGVLGYLAWKEQLPEARLSDVVPQRIIEAVGDWNYPGLLQLERWQNLDTYRNLETEPDTLLFGDSHIEQYGPRVMRLTQEGKARSVVFITGGGCPAIPDVQEAEHPNCSQFTEKLQSYLAAHPGIRNVVVGGAWNQYLLDDTWSKVKRNGYLYQMPTGQGLQKISAHEGTLAMAALRGLLMGIAETRKVYLMLDNPQDDKFDPYSMIPFDMKSRVETLHKIDNPTPGTSSNAFQQVPAQVKLSADMASYFSGGQVTVLDPAPSICPGTQCTAMDAAGRPRYKDHDHMRPFQVVQVQSPIDQAINRPSEPQHP